MRQSIFTSYYLVNFSLSCALFSTLLTQQCLGAEADHYTHRNTPLADISAFLDQEAEKYFFKAATDATTIGPCHEDIRSEQVLYTELRKYFANHAQGELVKRLLSEATVPRLTITLRESIYGEWNWLDGFILGHKKDSTNPLGLSPMIQVGEQRIGIDKLEHMFGMGHNYFTRHYLKNKKMVTVLRAGDIAERTYLGGFPLATGVFSYADLSANFNGMRFWNHILQKRPDILGSQGNLGPYIKCQDGEWKRTEVPFSFRNYIDASMDESINCSKFATCSGAKKVTRALEKRSTETQRLLCPMNPEAFQKMVEKYSARLEDGRPISDWILNFDGHIRVRKLPPKR